jgi:hypothetical protein
MPVRKLNFKKILIFKRFILTYCSNDYDQKI